MAWPRGLPWFDHDSKISVLPAPVGACTTTSLPRAQRADGLLLPQVRQQDLLQRGHRGELFCERLHGAKVAPAGPRAKPAGVRAWRGPELRFVRGVRSRNAFGARALQRRFGWMGVTESADESGALQTLRTVRCPQARLPRPALREGARA